MSRNISASLVTDDDGYLGRECPTCLGRFKVRVTDGAAVVDYCPYCAHEGADCWWTPEQLEYLQALALEQLQPEIDTMLEGLAGNSGFLSISVERSVPELPTQPSEEGGPSDVVSFSCCGAQAKIELSRLQTLSGELAPPTCVACGIPAT
ncbi:MAG: hypothetical protein V4550_15705 [Gemmatimonadota bacterium]